MKSIKRSRRPKQVLIDRIASIPGVDWVDCRTYRDRGMRAALVSVHMMTGKVVRAIAAGPDAKSRALQRAYTRAQRQSGG